MAANTRKRSFSSREVLEQLFDSDSDELESSNELSITDSDSFYSENGSKSDEHNTDNDTVNVPVDNNTNVTDVDRRNPNHNNNNSKDRVNSIIWKNTDNIPKIHPFTGLPGIKILIDHSSHIIDIFLSFVSEELLQDIVDQTNTFANNIISASPPSEKKPIHLFFSCDHF
jgi:hypothetical protein